MEYLPFSLSTSWNASRHRSGLDIVREIQSLGFDTIELSFALPRAIVDEIVVAKDAGAVAVSSLHNICPLPDEISPADASPDYYSLASPDRSVREHAVAVTKETIRYAARLGARAVVLHLGRVDIPDRLRALAAASGDAARFEPIKRAMIAEREAHKTGYLDRVIASLDELVPFGRDAGVALGAENRYHYREIPLIDEFETIFSAFAPTDLGYWHDVGHAQTFENLGLARHRDYLERFANRLLGVHLHDILQPMDDHRAPGCGTLDFAMLKPYLRRDTIRVIEAHAPATADEIRRGIAHLERTLG